MQIHPKREQCVNSSPQASASPSAHVSCSAFLPLLPCTPLPLSVRVFRRPSFSITGKVWEEINQQSIGRIQLDSKVVNPPYPHHSTPFTSLSRFGTDFQPRHLALVFRECPVDNYVWRRDRANRGSRKRSQTACLVLAGASDSVMELCYYIALTP